MHFFYSIAENTSASISLSLSLSLSLSWAVDAIRELEVPPPLLLSPLPSLCPCTKVKHTATAFTRRLKLDLPIISRIRIGLQSWELQTARRCEHLLHGECLYSGISLLTSGDWCWGSASSLDEAAVLSGTADVLYLIAMLGRLWCLNGANRCWLARSQSLKYF